MSDYDKSSQDYDDAAERLWDENPEEDQDEEEIDPVDEEQTEDEDSVFDRVPPEFLDIARKYKSQETLTNEELDKIADTAIDILRTLLKFFGAETADIDEYEGSDGELILDANNADLAILIGRHGRTLDSLQYIFRILLNNRLGFHYPVMLDIEGYKSRRRSKLESIAIKTAKKALQKGQEVRMYPMKPYERRIVHLALRHTEGVTTRSEGQEPNRCVIVVPLSKQTY